MLIGRFTSRKDGFFGRLQTFMIDVPLRLVPIAPGDNPKAPTWRVYRQRGAHPVEVGSGWANTTRQGGSMISLQIECPSLAQPLRAVLLPDTENEGHHLLIWSRDRSQQGSE